MKTVCNLRLEREREGKREWEREGSSIVYTATCTSLTVLLIWWTFWRPPNLNLCANDTEHTDCQIIPPMPNTSHFDNFNAHQSYQLYVNFWFGTYCCMVGIDEFQTHAYVHDQMNENYVWHCAIFVGLVWVLILWRSLLKDWPDTFSTWQRIAKLKTSPRFPAIWYLQSMANMSGWLALCFLFCSKHGLSSVVIMRGERG